MQLVDVEFGGGQVVQHGHVERKAVGLADVVDHDGPVHRHGCVHDPQRGDRLPGVGERGYSGEELQGCARSVEEAGSGAAADGHGAACVRVRVCVCVCVCV